MNYFIQSDKRKKQKRIVTGYFHQKTTTFTKVFSDFDDIFTVDRGFNYKHFDKKIFF